MLELAQSDYQVLLDAAGVTVAPGRVSGLALWSSNPGGEPSNRFHRALRGQPMALRGAPGWAEAGDWLGDVTDALAGALDDAFVDRSKAVWWRPRGRARVWIGDDFLRLWITQAPMNAAHTIDCQTAAEARFEALFGLSAAEWAITAEWDAITPFLCAAMPRRLLTGIVEVLSARGLRVDAIAPDFVEYWNHYQDRFEVGDWFAVVGKKRLTLATVERKGRFVRSVQPRRVKMLPRPQPVTAMAARGTSSAPSSIDATTQLEQRWLQQLITLEARRLGGEMPTRVLLGGVRAGRAGPAHWTASSTRFEWLDV